MRDEKCETWLCADCGSLTTFVHDHKTDLTGLDDGPEMRPPRKKIEPKPPEVTADIRARAWTTRRQKYGQHGHR